MSNMRSANSQAISIGFAARADGSGVAYARVRAHGDDVDDTTLRATFEIDHKPALEGRDVGYAAVAAVATELVRRGFRDVEIRVADARLAEDLAERRGVPQALVMPYVALRCALNRLRAVRIVVRVDRVIRDLTTRARADVTFKIAA